DRNARARGRFQETVRLFLVRDSCEQNFLAPAQKPAQHGRHGKATRGGPVPSRAGTRKRRLSDRGHGEADLFSVCFRVDNRKRGPTRSSDVWDSDQPDAAIASAVGNTGEYYVGGQRV